MDAAADKAALRVEYRRRLAALDSATRLRESRDLAATVDDWARRQGFDTLLATLPLPDEPNLTALLDRWLERGGSVALARTGAQHSLEFGFVTDLKGPWERRAGGLREPGDNAPLWQAGKRTLCLIPALAFAATERGVLRLGRGGGYFDRWLETHRPEIFALGTGFSVQLTTTLPAEPHDQVLHGLALPGQIIVPGVGGDGTTSARAGSP